MIDLTIVIANHETCALLASSLESIAKALAANPDLRAETIVVDNGSSDDSVAVARASSVRPRIVALFRNRGFAAAVNRALLLRRGRHVLLLNSDAEIEPTLLRAGVAILDSAVDVGAVGVALAFPDGRRQRSVHPLPSLRTELLPEPIVRRLWPDAFGASRGSASVRAYERVCEVEAVRGAVLFLRGGALDRIGLLDEGYFFFLEETDYCGRLRSAGYRVLYASDLHATHRLGASSKHRAPLATRIEFHRSLYRFLERWHGRWAAGLARGVRALRSAFSCLALLLPAVASDRARARLAQRWGLLLWHLRGCPRDPDLGEVLRSAMRSGERRGA